MTKTYRAANGHLMEYYIDPETGELERGYAWQAWHSDECACDGEPLPDW